MLELFSIVSFIFVLDKISQCVYNKFAINKSKDNHNARWFFIHAQVNLLIFLLTWRDVRFSLTNSPTAIFTPPTRRTTLAYYTAMISHMYHTLVFFNKLFKLNFSKIKFITFNWSSCLFVGSLISELKSSLWEISLIIEIVCSSTSFNFFSSDASS